MKIVYFSAIAYDDLKQRPQYIAEKLAEKYEVIYVEPTIRWVSYIFGRTKEYKGKVKKISANLTVVRCNGLFVFPFRWKPYDFIGIGNIAEKVQLKKYLTLADIVIIGYEGWTDVVEHLKNKKIVYDKMDDNALLTPQKILKNYLNMRTNRMLKNLRNKMYQYIDKYGLDSEKTLKISQKTAFLIEKMPFLCYI